MSTVDQTSGFLEELAQDCMTPELEHMFLNGRICHFDLGENIITEGEPTTYFYEIIDGTIALARNGRDGRRQILNFMGPRQILGVASTPGYPNLATALTPVVAIKYTRAHLENALATSPGFASQIRVILTRILESAHDHIYTIGQRVAIERLASFLLYLRSTQARYAKNGPQSPVNELELPMTRLDIADFLGLTIETVSRAFSAMKQKKLIAFKDSHSVKILNISALRELGGREDFTDKRGRTGYEDD